jgi:hypothetical protein
MLHKRRVCGGVTCVSDLFTVAVGDKETSVYDIYNFVYAFVISHHFLYPLVTSHHIVYPFVMSHRFVYAFLISHHFVHPFVTSHRCVFLIVILLHSA